MYPELISRPDIKVFLPPIGGLTVYIFGNHELISDPKTRLTVRVHDECNGSDVFCSDICTCRPYLIFGMVEAIKEAQNGGVGLIIYCRFEWNEIRLCATKNLLFSPSVVQLTHGFFLTQILVRKEGRALGEVTKYLVYNARKREGDSAAKYFERTENVAGVKDMRFQGLMPDVLHWLGITKIDRFMSMSNMKHDAIIDAGIQVHTYFTLHPTWFAHVSALYHTHTDSILNSLFLRCVPSLSNVRLDFGTCSHPGRADPSGFQGGDGRQDRCRIFHLWTHP